MVTFNASKALCLLTLVLFFAGCSGQQDAWVYIDNGLDTTMNIEIDGVEMAEVPARAFQKFVIPVGQRNFRVTSGAETIYEGKKNVAGSREAFVTQRYLFNPDANNLYWSYNVKYGEDSLFSKAIQKTSSRSGLSSEFHSLRKDFDVMPAEKWFAVPKGAYVLQDAPASRVASRGTTVAIKVVNRVQKEHYKFLKEAKTMRRPTKHDLLDLEHVISMSIID